MRHFTFTVSLFLIIGFMGCESKPASDEMASETAQGQELNVYTHRHYESDQVLFERFTEETGININVVNASADELIVKMENEGDQSPADVLITVDAGRLERAKEKGLLQPVSSEVLAAQVPGHLKDSEDYWYGLTKRARIIVYDKERGMPDNLTTYEGLADPAFAGDVLIRSSGNIYNQSLLASIIANNGVDDAREWAKGVVSNMARAPQGNDRDQMKAVVAGEGQVAVVNTYYLGHLMNSQDPAEVEVGKRIGLFFPNQDGRGAHINVSGIGVAAHAPNKEEAIAFIEFLSSVAAQSTFSSSNYEYPVNPEAQPSSLLQEWDTFKEDELSLSRLGELNKQAVLTFDEAGWN